MKWKPWVSPMKKCYHNHPEYVIKTKTGDYPIRGGSCCAAYPIEVGVFIGFDYGMAKGRRSLPWVEGHDVYYPIEDRGVPKNVGEFKKLIEWTAEQLKASASVYCGCIGGHGRTGLFLAALTIVMTGEKDAITVVRSEYCKKAVESASQVDWLVNHFGVKKVASSDSMRKTKSSGNAPDIDTRPLTSLPGVAGKETKKARGESGLVSEGVTTTYHQVDGHSMFVETLDK